MRPKSRTPETPSDRLVRDIRRATRKQYSAEEKIRIVLDGLRGEVTIAELCRREVIVEDASRFARELMAQELGITLLISRDVRLLTASGDDLTASEDPSRKMMRQIAGAFAEYEKARLVHKLRHARERQRKERGKCEGRKAHAEIRPDVVAEAKRLRRASPKTGARLSYRQISAKLDEAGFLNERGRPFNPKSVRSMLVG